MTFMPQPLLVRLAMHIIGDLNAEMPEIGAHMSRTPAEGA
jgi:hypothetical protein